MNIVFKTLRMHNFLSFGDAEITLDDNGFVFVQGINENPEDNASSNGCGKSSLWEAISWVLTGDTIRGTKDVVNIHGEDGTYVALSVIIDGKTFDLLRSKEHKEYKTNLLIYIDGKDSSGKGIRDSEKLLAQYIPDLTSSLLGSVIILGQGLPQKFSNNTPSGRKEVLEKLSKSDFMIEDLKSRISARKTYLATEIRKCEDELLSLQSTKKVYETQLEKAKSDLQSMESIDKYDTALAELTTKIDTYTALIDPIQPEIDKLLNEQSEINGQYSELVTSQNNDLAAIDSKYATETKSLTESKTQLTAEGYALKKETESLESIKDVCPTCGQKLPNISKPDTTEKRAKMQELATSVREIMDKITAIEEKIKAEKTTVALNYKVKQNQLGEQINQKKIRITELNSKLREYTNGKSSISDRINAIQSAKNQYATKKQGYEDTISDLTEKISKISDKMLYNNTRDNLAEHSKIVDKFETIIKRDFRGYLLGNVINYIDSKAKEYSQYIFNTDKISFSLDGNNIDIVYDGKEYSSLSGGERQKIDIIVQFSIRDMLCKFLNFTSNILVLDEITDNLDAVGCQKVIDLITSKISDISSVYIISHHSDLAIPYDRELTVVKSMNGISEIRGK